MAVPGADLLPTCVWLEVIFKLTGNKCIQGYFATHVVVITGSFREYQQVLVVAPAHWAPADRLSWSRGVVVAVNGWNFIKS